MSSTTRSNEKKQAKNIYNVIIAVLCVCIVAAAAAVVSMTLKSNSLMQNANETERSSTEAAETAQSEKADLTDDTKAEEETSGESTSISNIINAVTAEQTTLAETTSANVLTTYINSDTGRTVVDVYRDDWYFIVVNSGREMPEGYVPQLKEILGCGAYLDYRVAPHYEDMYYAAKKDGITLTPYSAYRSYDRQKRNYENLTSTYMSRYGISKSEAAKKAATVILPPGTSEHNLGLAMDICNTYDSFANTKEYAWLTANAYKYGFILRYTAEKQSITGIVPEPWHWRYVGVENAKKIKDSGLCLEEYLDSISVKY